MIRIKAFRDYLERLYVSAMATGQEGAAGLVREVLESEMSISDLQAGPELDAVIAEKVTGWKRELFGGRFHWFKDETVVACAEDGDPRRFSPSTLIAAAVDVVKAVDDVAPIINEVTGDRAFGLHLEIFSDLSGSVIVVSRPPEWGKGQHYFPFDDLREDGLLAICRAALKAVSMEEEAGSGNAP